LNGSRGVERSDRVPVAATIKALAKLPVACTSAGVEMRFDSGTDS